MQLLGIHYSSAFYSTLCHFLLSKYLDLTERHFFSGYLGPISRFEQFVEPCRGCSWKNHVEFPLILLRGFTQLCRIPRVESCFLRINCFWNKVPWEKYIYHQPTPCLNFFGNNTIPVKRDGDYLTCISLTTLQRSDLGLGNCLARFSPDVHYLNLLNGKPQLERSGGMKKCLNSPL